MTTPDYQFPQTDAAAWLGQVLRHISPDAYSSNTLPPLPDSLEEAWPIAAAFCGLTPWQLAQEVARQYGLRSEPLPRELPPEAGTWLKPLVARAYGAVAIRHSEGFLVVAVSNPAAQELFEHLRFTSGIPIELVVAPPADIRELFDSLVQRPVVEQEPDEQGDTPRVAVGQVNLEDQANDATLVRLSNLILRQAIERGASDIHIQPVAGGGLVRLRIDGMLRKAGRLPLSVMTRLITRIKAVSGLNPTDRMRPQDGSLRVLHGTQTRDLRISTLPVAGGEKLVARLLGGHNVLRLNDLGLPETERRQIQGLVNSSMGVVLVAGPTGSGKTTTLYAVLSEKNVPDVNIVTVEDPVEIRIPRLAQVEVNVRAELSFASALRSVVRQDPDIILIGEIRDAETAGIAMQAAITGHLVFASVHANDAVSVLPRLAELGVDRNLAGEAVRGIVSQRLVRALCHQCAQPAEAPFTPAETWLRSHARLDGNLRAVGCEVCGGTGYRGRRAILQILTNTRAISQLLDHGAPLSEVRSTARSEGMQFLSESALDRIRRGSTSVEEVLRVMGADFWREMGDVVGQEAPADLIDAVALGQDVEDAGAILLVVRDLEWLATLEDWLQQLNWRVVVAYNEKDVWSAIERDSDFAALLVDIGQLPEDRVRLLLRVRGSLAGAAVPMLAFKTGENPDLERHMGQQENALLVQRPKSQDELRGRIQTVLDLGS